MTASPATATTAARGSSPATARWTGWCAKAGPADRSPGLLKILRPDLATIPHLLLAIEIRYGGVIILHGAPLIIRLPLLPLIRCVIPLKDISVPVGEDVIAAGSSSLDILPASVDTAGSAAIIGDPGATATR